MAAGSLVVAVTAAGVNRSDTLACRGIIPCEFPRTLGRCDFAGVVVDGPRDLLGVRVWGSGGGELGLTTDGTHATHVVVACDGVSADPGRSNRRGGRGVSARLLRRPLGPRSRHRCRSADPTSGLEAGSTVVVTGAAGGVGGAAAALAHRRGARVVGVVLDGDELTVVERSRGAGHFDAVLASDTEDFPRRLRDAASGARAAVDVVGGAMVAAILPALALGGGVCVLGGPPHLAETAINTIDFYRKALRLVGLHTGLATSRDSARVLGALGEDFDGGHLTPSAVYGTYALTDAPRAYADVERGVAGRPVLAAGSRMTVAHRSPGDHAQNGTCAPDRGRSRR